MAYEKTNWQNGDVITAEKLNKIESQIADNVVEFEIEVDEQHQCVDAKTATYRTVLDIYSQGKTPIAHITGEMGGTINVYTPISYFGFFSQEDSVAISMGFASPFAIGEMVEYNAFDFDERIAQTRYD